MRFFYLPLSTLLFTIACAPVVSNQSMGLVDPGITFEMLRQDPDRHVGRYILVGGVIASVRIGESGGSEMEVVQFTTNDRGKIISTDHSAGRFILLDNSFRDPAIYYPGRLVTLVGQVAGGRTAKFDEVEYLYPVLTVHELHLWPLEEYPGTSPARFGIGIGIGVFH